MQVGRIPDATRVLAKDQDEYPVILPTLGLKSSQSHGILNPYAGHAEATPINETRMRQLAARILEDA